MTLLPVLRGLGALALVASLASQGVVAANAVPAPLAAGTPVQALVVTTTSARPTLTVVPGDRAVSLSWTRIKGASSYTIQYGTSKSFAKSKTKTITTTRTEKKIARLKDRTTYYVRVRSTVGVRSPYSAKRSATTTHRSTGRHTATVTPAGTNKVKVAWTRLTRGTSVTIIGSYSNGKLTDATKSFTITGIPATRTSKVVTIPARFRSLIGTGTGNPVYIRVITRNGSRKNFSPIVFSCASPTTPAGTKADQLSFATYNVANPTSTAPIKGRSWSERRSAVAAAILYAGADVVAVQEATTQEINSRRLLHYQDLAGLLRADYAMATTTSQIMDGTARTASKDSHLLYRPDRIAVLASGLASVKAQAKVYAPGASWISASGGVERDRYFTWALMKNRSTGARFYAVSLHLPTGSSGNIQNTRTAAIKGVVGYLTTLVTRRQDSTTPIVLMGDLNSDVENYPSGPPTYLVQKGFYNAAASRSRVNMRWSTTNNQEAEKYEGYRIAPFNNFYLGTRIDHIFVKNSPGSVRYVNQVIVRNGAFDERYRGSDHNLQYAVLSVPAT